VVARDDPLFTQHAAAWRWLPALAAALPPPLARGLWRWLRWRAQARAERIHARTRRDTLKRDHDLDRMMGFTGDAI
jgi:hypothetical protein